jgi:hypothetical protein
VGKSSVQQYSQVLAVSGIYFKIVAGDGVCNKEASEHKHFVNEDA